MKDGKPFLSVIIPVYNVEKYIAKCVNSVLNQKLQSFEIILIDDGSPDKCPKICDRYSERHKEIQVIHQQNSGLSEARNVGIRMAQGDYIIFMDSDDWWNSAVSVKHMLEIVKNNCDTEMFLFNSIDYIEGKGYFKRKEHRNLKSIRTQKVEYYYHDLLQNGNLEVAAYTKILSRKFLVENELYFKKGLLGEDNQWMLRILRKLNKVQIIDEPLYISRLSRKDSITHSIGKKNIDDLLTIIEESQYYCKNSNDRQRSELELCFCSYLWFSALGLSMRLTKMERMELLKRFEATADVCCYSRSPKTKLAYEVNKLMGIQPTAFFLGKYISFKSKTKFNKEKIS